MPSLPLPPSDETPKPTPKPAAPLPTGQSIKDRKLSEKWISAQGVRYDLGGYQLYFIVVAMGDSGYSGFSLMAHPDVFDKDQLEKMCGEAVSIVTEKRTAPRRKAIAADRTPIPDPKKMNEECFRADKELFESVLIDRFGFEQVQPGTVRVEIEPTIKGVQHGH